MEPSDTYQQKKQMFARMITVFGRNPVMEALQDDAISAFKLHLAESNRASEGIRRIEAMARARGIETVYHTRQALARISKNGKQDQGVALDVRCEHLAPLDDLLSNPPEAFELLALDGITNPQNLGMIIRSVCASPMHGLLLPDKGCAKLDALVIKASAGTLFRATIYRCDNLSTALRALKHQQAAVYGLAAHGRNTIGELTAAKRSVYVLGNETAGLSETVQAECTEQLRIPMSNGVESLNVSVAASLIAFRNLFKQPAQGSL